MSLIIIAGDESDVVNVAHASSTLSSIGSLLGAVVVSVGILASPLAANATLDGSAGISVSMRRRYLLQVVYRAIM